MSLNEKEPVSSMKKEKVNNTVTSNAHSESTFVKRQVSTKVSKSFAERGVSFLMHLSDCGGQNSPFFLTRRLIYIAIF